MSSLQRLPASLKVAPLNICAEFLSAVISGLWSRLTRASQVTFLVLLSVIAVSYSEGKIVSFIWFILIYGMLFLGQAKGQIDGHTLSAVERRSGVALAIAKDVVLPTGLLDDFAAVLSPDRVPAVAVRDEFDCFFDFGCHFIVPVFEEQLGAI